jgi:hypothetical protein
MFHQFGLEKWDIFEIDHRLSCSWADGTHFKCLIGGYRNADMEYVEKY